MKNCLFGTACRSLLLAAAFVLTLAPARAVITSFDDITFWVGSGSNEAALVIAWNNGVAPVSLAWGFRWNGIATGQDMLQAIAGTTMGDVSDTGADPRLTIYITSFSFGDAVDRIVYSPNQDRGGFTDTGYWEYFNMGGEFLTPPDGDPNTFAGSSSYPGTNGTPDWISSWTGFSDRVLSDGSWDAWSYANNGVTQGVQAPVAAVPEPSALLLTSLGIGLLVWRRRHGSAARIHAD